MHDVQFRGTIEDGKHGLWHYKEILLNYFGLLDFLCCYVFLDPTIANLCCVCDISKALGLVTRGAPRKSKHLFFYRNKILIYMKNCASDIPNFSGTSHQTRA